MLETPQCHVRKCKHLGAPVRDKDEKSERPACAAFPAGIPYEIAYGDNPHAEPVRGQGNRIVYERE